MQVKFWRANPLALLRGALVAAVTVGTLLAAAPALATYPGHNGFIVYAKGRSLISIDADADHNRLQYNVGGIENMANPAVSPHGQSVVWRNTAYTDQNLYLTHLCDSDAFHAGRCKTTTRLVTQHLGSRSFEAAWSPDGKHLAYGCITNGYGDYGVCEINPDGSGYKVLSRCGCYSPTGYESSGIEWSPNGRRILVGDGMTIYSIPAYGGPAKTTLLNPAFSGAQDGSYYAPRFSPDGTKILFTQEGGAVGNGYSIEEANADGSDRHIILEEWGDWPYNYYPQWATWSPDGQKVIFQAGNQDIGSNLYVYGRDSSVPNSSPMPQDISQYSKLLPDSTNLGTDRYSEVTWGPSGM